MANNQKKGMSIATVMLFALTAIMLVVCLVITSVLLAYSNVANTSVLYATGTVNINLNDGEPVITGDELFAPGKATEKTFFVENDSSEDVYYRIYFTEIQGELASQIEVEICEEDELLYSGILSEMTRERTSAVDDILKLHERRDLTVRFTLSLNAGDDYQNTQVSFRLAAEATQVRNNPLKLF